MSIATIDDIRALESAPKASDLWPEDTVYRRLQSTAARTGGRPGITFQLKSGPKDPAVTLSWEEVRAETARCANLLRSLGVGPTDTVAYILPNSMETAITLLGGMTAGVVAPINPLLEPRQIAGILRENGAKVVVTLAPFPKTDIAQKVAEALADAPDVQHVLTVDLLRYLTPPTAWLVPLMRPKVTWPGRVNVQPFGPSVGRQPEQLTFEEVGDRECSCFHTGGTTGLPKVARHTHQGILYQGWVAETYFLSGGGATALLCPLPLFHIFAAYPSLIGALFGGAHVIFPTPAGYRGDGVFDNFWKLVERYKVTFFISVPTAASQLMQRDVDADVSTLRYALSGSAPMPKELFGRFEEKTGVRILEGYGLTESTCLVSANPPEGQRKIGSIGLPFPYCNVRILHCDGDGKIDREAEVDEVGEICVENPGVRPGSTYTDEAKNLGLHADGRWLRTGDMGRMDADGYIWITGRLKDLIIRGGHNIDPGEVEESVLSHPAVAFAGAIGQPDPHSGEVPCLYVELTAGGEVTPEELHDYSAKHIGERAGIPKHIEILDELPKTAVGKVFKPDLRKRAIARVFDEALRKGGVTAWVSEVVDDKRLGLTAELTPEADGIADAEVDAVLGAFARPWRWAAR